LHAVGEVTQVTSQRRSFTLVRLYRGIRVNPRRKKLTCPKKTRMRLGASHLEPHRAWIPAFATSPRTRRNDCLGPTALPKECHICQSRLPIRDLAITPPQPLRWPAALPARSKERGRRPQRPGNQSRLRAYWMYPRQSALTNYRLPLALPQSSGQVRNLTFR
jgi:hypothetical protein